MGELNNFLNSNMIVIWGALLVASLMSTRLIARLFARGWIRTLFLVPLVLLATIVLSSLLSLALTLHFVGWPVFTLLASDPLAFGAYYLETGLEYCAMILPISLAAFIFYRNAKKEQQSSTEVVS